MSHAADEIKMTDRAGSPSQRWREILVKVYFLWEPGERDLGLHLNVVGGGAARLAD